MDVSVCVSLFCFLLFLETAALVVLTRHLYAERNPFELPNLHHSPIPAAREQTTGIGDSGWPGEEKGVDSHKGPVLQKISEHALMSMADSPLTDRRQLDLSKEEKQNRSMRCLLAT